LPVLRDAATATTGVAAAPPTVGAILVVALDATRSDEPVPEFPFFMLEMPLKPQSSENTDPSRVRDHTDWWYFPRCGV
jgi:hypothetical protein